MYAQGWNIVRNGCFQTMDSANKSLNLTHFVRRLVPRYLLPSESDGELTIGLSPRDASMN